jgi:hypothetical protein
VGGGTAGYEGCGGHETLAVVWRKDGGKGSSAAVERLSERGPE